MPILDAKGRPIAKQAEPAAFVEIGRTGLKRHGGFVREEWHKDLRGRHAIEMYREMSDNHPIIGAVFLLVELLIRQVSQRVDATGDTPEHEAARELCDRALEEVQGGVLGIYSNALQMLRFGFAWLEKVFTVRDGTVIWAKLASRSAESMWRWDFDEVGEVLAMVQRAAPDFVERTIPRAKSVHFRLLDDGKNNPEGRALLRNAYTSYYHQKWMMFSEAVGVDRNMVGFPKFSLPPNIIASDDPKHKAAVAVYKEIGEKTRVDEFACWVVPAEEDRDGKTGYGAELISASGKNVADTDPIIKRYASWVAISLLAKFMLLGVDKHGSFALASSDTDFFALAVAAVLDTIQGPFNEELFPELLELNGMDPKFAPEWTHGDIEKVDMTALATTISTLAGTGAIKPDADLEDHLREEIQLPPAKREETTEEPAEEDPLVTPEQIREAMKVIQSGGNGNGDGLGAVL